MLVLLIVIWIACIPWISRIISASIQQQKARHNYNIAVAAAEAERERKEAERIAAIERKENERQQKENEKRQKELEMEKQRLASVERKQAEARTIIEHYEPIRLDLIERIKRLEKEYRAADQANKSGAALEKLKKPLDSAKEKLFQTERKLERAYFIVNE